MRTLFDRFGCLLQVVITGLAFGALRGIEGFPEWAAVPAAIAAGYVGTALCALIAGLLTSEG